MRICMLVHRSVEHDGRVRRETSALAAAGHEVIVLHLPDGASVPDGPLDGGRVRSVAPRPWVRRLLPRPVFRLVALLGFVRATVAERPDAVHAHDAAMLLPGAIAARIAGARLVYDSHELATGVPYREPGWGLLVRTIERLIVPRCSLVITVSDGIAERLRELYGLEWGPVVVRNVPDPELIGSRPASTDLRSALGVGDDPLLIHNGSAAPGRGSDVLVRAIALLPCRLHLVFLGVDPKSCDGALLRRRAREAGVDERVHLRPPVPLPELLAHTRQADVGVSLLEDSCENHRLALPNKVFEYLAAGLPVVVSDLPELERLVSSYGCGRSARPSDPAAVAAALEEVLRQPGRHGPGIERARHELTWAHERERLVGSYRKADPPAAAATTRPLRATSGRRLSRTLSRARWREYAQLLDSARQHGYRLVSLADWVGEPRSSERVLILRHDVDQAPSSALRMARIEHAAGAASTWYFRWRTADPGVIDEVRRLGGSVGLHYETLTRMALEGKARDPRDPEAVGRARKVLGREVERFQALFGPIASIAAHGDSRVPEVQNADLVRGIDVSELGVAFDANEAMRGRGLAVWMTDRSAAEGGWVDRMVPEQLFVEGVSPILCLTHPNNWMSGPGLWADRIAGLLLPSPSRDRAGRLPRTGGDEP